MTGRRLITTTQSLNYGRNTIELKINKLPAGVYTLWMSNDTGDISTRKWIKE